MDGANINRRKGVIKLDRLEVGRYSNPKQVGGWAGWVCPVGEDGFKVPAWILFIHSDGTLTLGRRDDRLDQLMF